MRNLAKLLSCIIVIFCSCGKDSTNTDNTNPTPTAPVLLKKFILLNPSAAPPGDTLGIIEYTYDNLNRCIATKDVYYPGMESELIHNSYIGNDTTMAGRLIIYPGSNDTTKEFFRYSGGKMIADSLVTIDASGTYLYVYNYQDSGNNFHSVISGATPPAFLLADYYLTIGANGNIIAEKDSSYEYINATSTYVFKDVTDFAISYDTKPCPFYNLYPKLPTGLEYENYTTDFIPFYISLLQKNNTLSETRVSFPPGLLPFNNSYSYTYNTNDYPAIVIYTNNLTGLVSKGLYVY